MYISYILESIEFEKKQFKILIKYDICNLKNSY